MKKLLLLLTFAVVGMAQPAPQVGTLYYSTDPTGTSCNGPLYLAYSSSTHTQFYCNSSLAWTAFSTGGGGVTTSAPLTGTTALACPTCVSATSPGVGLAHFAGSTQAVTSSAVSLSADVSGNLPVANGGTNASTAPAALVSLFPVGAETGDMVYCSAFSVAACTTWSAFAGNTSGTAVLQETASGVPSFNAAPAISAVNMTAFPAPAGGLLPGAVASIITASGAINTVETSIVSYTIPANSIKAGTTYRIRVYGTCTSSVSNVSTIRVRLGSTGTSSDTNLGGVTPSSAASGTNNPFSVDLSVVFQSTTVAQIAGNLANNGSTGVSNLTGNFATPANTTGLTTSSNQVIQFSYVSAASTTTSTFQVAVIELVKP